MHGMHGAWPPQLWPKRGTPSRARPAAAFGLGAALGGQSMGDAGRGSAGTQMHGDVRRWKGPSPLRPAFGSGSEEWSWSAPWTSRISRRGRGGGRRRRAPFFCCCCYCCCRGGNCVLMPPMPGGIRMSRFVIVDALWRMSWYWTQGLAF